MVLKFPRKDNSSRFTSKEKYRKHLINNSFCFIIRCKHIYEKRSFIIFCFAKKKEKTFARKGDRFSNFPSYENIIQVVKTDRLKYAFMENLIVYFSEKISRCLKYFHFFLCLIWHILVKFFTFSVKINIEFALICLGDTNRGLNYFNIFFFFPLSYFLQFSKNSFSLSKKKGKRVGDHYWRKVLPTGTGEKENPMLPMGRREKSPIDHRN